LFCKASDEEGGAVVVGEFDTETTEIRDDLNTQTSVIRRRVSIIIKQHELQGRIHYTFVAKAFAISRSSSCFL